MEKRLRDIEARLAEGADQINNDKPNIVKLGGVASVLRY